ncbi:MAG: hypothetical protein F4X76_02090 [Chloroflexi bacterium]|nr:hypothetical protein [Chloroflexota bacterium]
MSTIRRPLVSMLLTLAMAASAACGGGEPEAPPPAPPARPIEFGEAEIAAYLSERTMELWVVYNRYHLQGLRAFYEESYWLEEEEELRRNMAPFESRGITFTAEETSPPRQIEPGKWELKHKVSFSGGSLNMRFIYERFDGEWLLTHAETD